MRGREEGGERRTGERKRGGERNEWRTGTGERKRREGVSFISEFFKNLEV
jgi:hypothetical protein